jgi:hypothetical protein
LPQSTSSAQADDPDAMGISGGEGVENPRAP